MNEFDGKRYTTISKTYLQKAQINICCKEFNKD